MATLYWKTAKKRIALRGRSLFGRHPECYVRVDSPKVSSEHASLHWVNGVWELRDLGSRNGTYVDNRRLAPGDRAVMKKGATFSLSRSAAVFEMVDAAPPAATATHKESGKVYVADSGMLALPNEQNPQVTIFSTSDDVWQIEMESQVRSVVNQEAIKLGDATYIIEVPTAHPETLQSGASGVLLESIRLHFAVAPDEEQVDVTVLMGGQSKRLVPRAYHYMLLTLARARLADAHAPASMRGWLGRDDLCNKLDMDLNRMNVEIHRVRKQLAALGVQGAAKLVERRPGTHEIRLGVADIEVVRL